MPLLNLLSFLKGPLVIPEIGMCIVGLDGRIQQVNRRMTDYLGYTESEFLEMTFQDFTHPDDLDTDLEFTQRAIEGEFRIFNIDKRYIAKNGSSFWASLNAALIRNSANEPLYFIAHIQDINERKLYEDELQQVNQNLKKLSDRLTAQNRSLNDFAHITSHNLRAPVANLMQLKDLYQIATKEEERAEVFDKIAQSTDQLSETLNYLMNALSIKEKLDIKFTYLDLEQALLEQWKRFDGWAKDCGARLELDLKFKKLLVNPDYIESILHNLFHNALRYQKEARKPKVLVEASIENYVPVLKIKDNGIGINLDRHGDKVFGLHKTFHSNSGAKGVGLFMVKTQMEAMGGEVSLQSEVDKGTTFVLRFKKNSAIK